MYINSCIEYLFMNVVQTVWLYLLWIQAMCATPGPILIYSHCPKDRTATGKDRTSKRLQSWTSQQPVQTGLILYNILSSMVGVRLTNVWFSCKKPPAIHNLMIGGVSCQKNPPFLSRWMAGFPGKKPLPFIIWWLVEFPAKKPAIHKSMNGGFSWEKARHSPIYKLRLVNKSPKDAEDINKLTYQKTGPDWSRLVQ